MIHTFHNGFKITDWFGDRVKVETFTGCDWKFIFDESSLESAKNRIDIMGVICKSSVSLYYKLLQSLLKIFVLPFLLFLIIYKSNILFLITKINI